MYGKPFNHNRPFGVVHGDTRWAFDQDGQLYDALKNPVDGNGRPMPLPPVAKAAAPEPVKAPAPAAADDDDDTPEDEKPIDLLAWAQGHPDLAGLPWQTVRAAAAETLGDITAFKKKAELKAAIFAHFDVPETPAA